jgi:hypothetical protein
MTVIRVNFDSEHRLITTAWQVLNTCLPAELHANSQSHRLRHLDNQSDRHNPICTGVSRAQSLSSNRHVPYR